VYDTHRIGPRLPSDPKADASRLERKVRTYMAQSVALEQIWNAPLTAEALAREWERIARSTRFPDRLRELYRALGDDPFLIQECLVRPELVDHLARGRFTHDATIHTLGVPETTWDDWWSRTEPRLEMQRFQSIALHERPPMLLDATTSGGPECTPDTWLRGGLDDLPSAKTGHLAFWTGSLMLVYGSPTRPGSRYDPLIDRWTSMSSTGAPTSAPTSAQPKYFGVWTGSEMLVTDGATGNAGRYDPVSDTWSPMASGGAFGYGASAVWTGSEMIVWGGGSGGVVNAAPYTNAGKRYNPTTNTWTAMSTTNAPLARGFHTAVWTGSEMIVWGGTIVSNNTFTNTGGRYNPALDQWTPMSTFAAPTSRVGHVAVWGNGEMIVHGGVEVFASAAVQTGGRYNPSSDSWTATANTGAPPRAAHTAIWTGSYMLVWGGNLSQFGGQQNTGAKYDPASGWSDISSTGAPSARMGHSAVWTGTRMLVWGGGSDSTSIFGKGYNGGQYVASTNSWLPMTGIGPRDAHTAVWTGNEMIVWGGDTLVSGIMTNTGARYDATLATWRETSTVGAPAARSSHYAVWTGTQMIVWGGAALAELSSGGRYDPLTDTWSGMSVPGFSGVGGSFGTVVWTGTEMIAWGGTAAYGGRYNPVQDTWTQTAPFPGDPRAYTKSVWTGTEMIVWGGWHDNPSTYYGDGGRYNPATNSWSYIPVGPNSPTPRDTHSLVWTGQSVLVFGGQGPAPGADVGGRYNPQTSTWSAMSTVNEPTPAYRHTAVWTGGRMLVWGGSIPTAGGSYDPTSNSWSVMSTTGAPSRRNGHTGVWSGRSMMIWGGEPPGGTIGPDNDGAEYFPDSDADGLSDACDNCPLLANAGQADQDGDGIGDACDACPATPDADVDHDGATTCTDCDDSNADVYPGAPARCDGINNDCNNPSWPSVVGTPDADADGDTWLVCEGDCNDSVTAAHPGAIEICDGIDDDCDALIDEDELGVDTDGDNVRNACDNCRTVHNPSQSDGDGDRVGNACDNCASLRNPSQTDDDHDAQGDVCDLDDGLIYILFNSRNLVEWQQESGFTTWNSYRGSLAVLRSSGVYTQAPGSNPLAQRDCGLASPSDAEAAVPNAGEVAFWLVTGKNGGVESSLGTNSVGAPRPNANPCP
jgi:N-acetylneuraminic acid mutarotase